MSRFWPTPGSTRQIGAQWLVLPRSPRRRREEAAIEGLTAGADDYIAKPFSPRELVARIAASIERFRAEVARQSEAELRARNEELERFNEVTLGQRAADDRLEVGDQRAAGASGESLRYPLQPWRRSIAMPI